MTDYRLIIDDKKPGAWNMAVDAALLESAGSTGQATLRFYQWSVPTLSLGYFQKLECRQEHVASLACPIVRRSSGGGAIVHDHEITYSLAMPMNHRWSATAAELYTTVHESLIELLRGFDIECDSYAGRSENSSFLCFQRRAAGDIILNQHKVMGSAQRRATGALLQHGSLLLRRSAAAPELPGLLDIVDWQLLPSEIIYQWIVQLRRRLSADFCKDTLVDEEVDRINCFASEKYNQEKWTQRR